MTDQRSAATGWIAPPADWEEVRARLAGLAEEYARFLAGRDPAAAEATGLPGEEPLPVTGPEALAERADIERRLRRRVSAVEPVRGPGEGADGGLGDGGHGDHQVLGRRRCVARRGNRRHDPHLAHGRSRGRGAHGK